MTREEKIKALDKYCDNFGNGDLNDCHGCKLEKPCECDDKCFKDLTDEQLDNALALIMTREEKIAELCKSNAYSWSFFKDMPDYRVDAYYNFHRKVHGFIPTMSKPVAMEFEKGDNVHESEQAYDTVDRPKHYASTSIECIDAMIETQGEEAVIDFCICNAFKYLWRHREKNGDEDVRKANWYLNKAVELMDKYEKPIEF